MLVRRLSTLSSCLLPAIGLLIAPAMLGIAAPATARAPSADPALEQAVAAPGRTDAARARDQYRHPVQTLGFFGVKPTDTVVEIWPGNGWYSEILARYLAPRGRLILAPPAPGAAGIDKVIAAQPDLFAKVARANFPSTLGGTPVPDNSVDVALTFRNVHNWRMGSMSADKADYSAAAFAELFRMLKPGGTLGVVDHRLPEKADPARERSSGYIRQSTVIALATQAGFKLVASSEINANPKDTADWPDGVWTLPPSYRLGDVDRARYAAIGESDRMTLKFVKPRR